MPYVNIRVTDEAVTRQQKEDLVQRATQMLVEVLGKDPRSTFVVIDEVCLDNWGVGGQLVSDLRRTKSVTG